MKDSNLNQKDRIQLIALEDSGEPPNEEFPFRISIRTLLNIPIYDIGASKLVRNASGDIINNRFALMINNIGTILVDENIFNFEKRLHQHKYSNSTVVKGFQSKKIRSKK